MSKLRLGSSIALVSNAGTPLISDPGYSLVRACRSCGIRIVPLPGACAAITALSASGLSAHRFCFEGFLPSKRQVRINYFQTLLKETRTLIFYDSKYRIIDSIQDMINIFGSERRIVLARELTKIWESIYEASLEELLKLIKANKVCIRGEMVLVLEGYHSQKEELQLELRCLVHSLVKELPCRKVVDLVVNVYGVNKNIVYNYLLKKKFYNKI